jgi:hypothetical protein
VDTKTVKPLSEQRVVSIRQDLLDTLITSRKQTPEEMAAWTRKIASKRKVTVQQVAGVRAAMSRGSYGKLPTLLRNRRKATS